MQMCIPFLWTHGKAANKKNKKRCSMLQPMASDVNIFYVFFYIYTVYVNVYYSMLPF